jgi:hypothetical protein
MCSERAASAFALIRAGLRVVVPLTPRAGRDRLEGGGARTAERLTIAT